MMINSLSNLPLREGVCFDYVKRSIGSICHRYFDSFDPSKVFSPIISRGDLSLLRNFSSDKSLVVTKPNKGRGVVILDRSSYNDKMETIVSDRSKFSYWSDFEDNTTGRRQN